MHGNFYIHRFYEWKIIGNKQKQPYFIYFPQEKDSDIFTQPVKSYEDKNWNGPRLLTMAGLFDIWKNSQVICTINSLFISKFINH